MGLQQEEDADEGKTCEDVAPDYSVYGTTVFSFSDIRPM